ncbi:hypothetical protein SAMN05444274_101146 [Mariniphaga anaerophila]|uniref:Uncharacterized protein n=1 Tax=Mariniphaga anaerophila TaxID=1484053 RepID=A0A1M4STZ1_9BACT|nr:hypothetical protein [Mariniphaga anaerophila]SHE35629.1 hypothetical protein SAMN05444274_101146 [Mariniphaga anaerophila]
MKTQKVHFTIGGITFFFVILLFIAAAVNQSAGQAVAIKSWTGTYPEMNKSYPVVFVAVKKGVPHVFIRYLPTHNYKDLFAKSVVDGTEIAGKTKADLVKTLLKLAERSLMKGRLLETEGILSNTDAQKRIVQELFEARFDQLGDQWNLTRKFVAVYHKIDAFPRGKTNEFVKETFEHEAEALFFRFLLVNRLESDHGQKMDSYRELHAELSRLLGELDYTFRKLQYYETAGATTLAGYSVLTP